MATNGVVQEEENVENAKDTFSQFHTVLEQLRPEEFTWDEDINFLQSFFKDKSFKALCEVNDGVARSQGFDQPMGSTDESLKELFSGMPSKTEEGKELLDLLNNPYVQTLLSVHDTVRTRTYETPLPAYDPSFHPINYHPRHKKGTPQYRTVGLHKTANEPLGITLKLLNNKLIIARILYGGIIHRQGLLKVGDRIVDVNGESADALSPAELQTMLKHSSGSLVIKVEPGYHESVGVTEIYMRAHFDYNPKTDRLIPSQEAGMPFRTGDVVKVINQEDSFWWQAVKYGEHDVAGLIPSQMLEERRKAYNNLDGHAFAGCLGKKKQKRRIMYSSHHSGEFENYDLVLYEPVVMVENFQYRSLVLIGAPNIGRRSLKTRLLTEYSSRFAEVRAHTTREPRTDEDRSSFHFVSEEHMKADIMAHKFIEFGKHQQHLYGIKSDSILEVIRTGKMCILDVHPQALKLLRTQQFRPLVIFVKAVNPEGVRKLHQSARVDNPSGQSMLTEKDFIKCAEESDRIESLYGHYFNCSVVNENIDNAYEDLLAAIREFSSGKHWVPSNWVM